MILPRVIWKFHLNNIGSTVVEAGYEPRVVHFGPDPAAPGFMCAWVELTPWEMWDTHPIEGCPRDLVERLHRKSSTLALAVFGTGWEIPEGHDHVASTVDGSFVWHLYQLPNS